MKHLAGYRRSFVAALGTVTAAGLFAFSGGSPASAQPTTPLALSQLKEVNYMPSANAWTDVWTNWNPTQINSDYALLAANGANTVRVIIEPSAFGFPNLNPTMVARLNQVIAMAQGQGLRVQLTLFDWFSNFDQLANSQQWIQSLITPLQNSPEVAFIELKNEIDPTSSAQIAWAQAELPVLRAAAGSIPITLSVRGNAGAGLLAQLKSEMGTVQPDFYDLHYYGLVGDAADTFSSAEAAVAPLPLYIGESGISTDVAATGLSEPVLDSRQDLYIKEIEGATADLGLPAAAPWTLYDLLPSAVPSGVTVPDTELYFGLIRTDGTPKPALSAVSQFFATGQEPILSNTSFENAVGGVPTDWNPDNPGSGTLAWDPTVSHSGTASISLSKTTGTSGAQAGFHTTANTGLLSAGQQWQASVWAKGVAATGASELAVSWFNATGGYLGVTLSPAVAQGNSNWTKLSLTTAVPAGATSAEVHLQSYLNSGTVWFDDVSFSRAN